MSECLQTYETPEITVTFDPAVCIHSGVCLAGNPPSVDAGLLRRAGRHRPAGLRG